MRTINIDNKNDGKKLNTILLKEFPALSINSFYKALRKKDIRINDVRVSENITVHLGDTVKIFIADDILFGTANFSNNKLVKCEHPKHNRSKYIFKYYNTLYYNSI